MSMPGPAAHRAAEVAGPDLARCRAASSSCSCRLRKISRAPSSRSTARSGPRDVADEQRVAAEHRPRLVAAGAVDQRERRVLGAVARRVQRAHDDVAELELPAVVERLVLVLGRGEPVDVDRRAGRVGQPAVAGDVVGVVVGLEDVLDSHTHVPCEVEVHVDLEARIDDRRDSGPVVTDEVGRTSEVVVGDLPEEHALRRYIGVAAVDRPRTYSHLSIERAEHFA